MRLVYFCLLTVALHSLLANAQWVKQDPQRPQRPQDPQRPQRPQDPQRPQRPQDPQRPQKPQDPQRPQIGGGSQQPQSPKQPQLPKNPTEPFHTCQVDDYYKIDCGHPGITGPECENINCCFDGRRCYYGKSVTLQCTKDGQFIIVVARDATLPNIDLESLSFLGGGSECQAVGTTSAFAIYQFPVTACGTVATEEPGVLIYENRMSSFFEVAVGDLGIITRDTQYELFVQCRYIGTSVEAVVVEVGLVPPPHPVAAPGPLRVELRLANGACTSKGCVEAEVAYTSFYTDADYPVTKVLREPVYVEVRALERTDPNLVLTLGRCWATIGPYPQSLPQWDLLIDGCPNRDDRYLTQLIPVDASSGLQYPSHHRRFVFKMFTFVAQGQSDASKKVPGDDQAFAPLREKIHIHCDVAVCQRSNTNDCEPRCFRKRREISASTKKLYREEPTVVSSKEVVFTQESSE